MFFSLFHFSDFNIFSLLHFILFCVLSLFLFFWFLLFLHFVDFCQFLSLFIVVDDFWSIFVTKLGASTMTHFSPSISALPLSPLLVVKFDLILCHCFLINFWWFLVNFCVNYVNFCWKLDFAIKNHCFWHFFDYKFEWFLINLSPFFDPFWGFLGGYPSPSISAPLVVKKCPKLYIYIYRVTRPPMISTTITGGPKLVKCQKCTNAQNQVFRFIEGRTRVEN